MQVQLENSGKREEKVGGSTGEETDVQLVSGDNHGPVQTNFKH